MSYSDIVRSGAPLSVGEAVVLVIAAAQKASENPVTGKTPSLPSCEQVFLDAAGGVTCTNTGDDVTDAEYATQLAALLRQLLHLDATRGIAPRRQVPGSLLVIVARAARDIDLPPLSSSQFLNALSRFGVLSSETLASVYRHCSPDFRDVVVPSGLAVVVSWRGPRGQVVIRWPSADRQTAARRRGRFAVIGAVVTASLAVVLLGLLWKWNPAGRPLSPFERRPHAEAPAETNRPLVPLTGVVGGQAA